VSISLFRPAVPVNVPDPFDHEDFIFELKYDGFRAVAHVTPEQCQLVSRRANTYKSFRGLCASLGSLNCQAVLDGEIVILDHTGRPQFYDLLRRRGEPIFYVFDLLMLDGRDLRRLPLLERKRALQQIVKDHPRILFARHVERHGCDLFKLVCERDLERIVAKRRDGVYGEDWFKIRDPKYSQYEGRRESFERRVKGTAA
jgi:bifunctional non-homologous end joining protein LigD